METADVVIVGGGAIGTSVAYYLRKTGTERVILLERAGLGAGATGQAAGLIRHQYSNELLVRLAVEGRRRLQAFREETGEDIGLVENGLLLLMSEADAEATRRNFEMQKAAGVNVSLLCAEQVKDALPQFVLVAEGVGVGIFDHDAAYCDPYRVAIGYGRRAAELGADVRVGTAVTKLRASGDKVTTVSTSDGDIAAGIVVNAAGPWAARLNKDIGVDLPLSVMSLQHGVILSSESYDAGYPTLIDNSFPGNLYFIKPESGGTILIGLDKEDPTKLMDPDTYCFDPPYDTLAELAAAICKRVPAMRTHRLQNVFGALDSLTPDWNPMLGYAEGFDNYLCAVGFSGHGLKLAPCIGEVLANLVRGETPVFDISPLDISRFRAGASLDGFRSVLA